MQRPCFEMLTVVRAIAGDRDALTAVLVALRSPLAHYIGKLLSRRESAEDALQEVLILICTRIRWLRDPELVRPWAFRIASRQCFRLLRLEKHRNEEPLDWEPQQGAAGEAPEWEPHLIEWVDALPPASRSVILLHYFEEMTLAEIAAVLEVSLGTVKSRLAYGLAALRQAALSTKLPERTLE